MSDMRWTVRSNERPLKVESSGKPTIRYRPMLLKKSLLKWV